MPSAKSDFTIDVNVNGVTESPTSPSKGGQENPTGVSNNLRFFNDVNNAVSLAAVGAAISLGKTYVNLQYNKTENVNKSNRFNLALRFGGYVVTTIGGFMVGGPAGAAVGAGIGVSVTKDIMQYNNSLDKQQIKYNFINEKLKQNTANGSRWLGGGS